jgi:hypothetical protein
MGLFTQHSSQVYCKATAVISIDISELAEHHSEIDIMVIPHSALPIKTHPNSSAFIKNIAQI